MHREALPPNAWTIPCRWSSHRKPWPIAWPSKARDIHKLLQLIRQVLENDPRPAYHITRPWDTFFRHARTRFLNYAGKLSKNRITVIALEKIRD